MMQSGAFREDLFYRLCSDMIEVPSLHERVDDDPRELSLLIKTLVARMLGGDTARAAAIEDRVRASVGDRYAWTGNFQATGRRLRLDRRTVKATLDESDGGQPAGRLEASR